MKDVSRRIRKSRRKVYRQLPIASSNRLAELDHRMSYAEMAAALQQANCGVPSAGAALALWRACTDRGLAAWCYEFGFAETLTHTMTIVESDGVLQPHDPFFNVSYPLDFYDMLDSLMHGNAVTGKRAAKDRKIYIADPACEPAATVRWLEAKADREIEPVGGLRRFEVLWDAEAFIATHPAIDPVFRALAARGYPADLQFLMLHPVAVFDGAFLHRDRAGMPLVGGHDLTSPVAALRVATRELEAERARASERIATISRLEAELARANEQVTAARNEAEQTFAAEREAWLQQKVALQADRGAIEGELAKTRTQLSTAVDLRAQRDSRIAQLRAEIEDAARQLEDQQKALAALQSKRQEWEAERVRRESENRDLLMQVETAGRENEELHRRAALADHRAAIAAEHTIDMTEYIASLLAPPRTSEEAETGGLIALRRRLTAKLALPFRIGRPRRRARSG